MVKSQRPSAKSEIASPAGRGLVRPYPPSELCGVEGAVSADSFLPAPDLSRWIIDTYVEDSSVLVNEDHAHLRYATFGCLWTNVDNARAGRKIVGQAELMPPQGAMGKWQKARALQQISEWFGEIPTFLLTFDARYAAECDDASFCALVEHELYHCGQELDMFGAPKFTRDGEPKFAMKGHDVEEFIGVVRRYGSKASNAHALIEAARKPPQIAQAQLNWACGSCMRAAA